MTDQIADAVMDVLEPDRRRRRHRGGPLLHDDAGVEKQNSRTVTSALRGIFRDDSKTRVEFLRLAHGGRSQRVTAARGSGGARHRRLPRHRRRRGGGAGRGGRPGGPGGPHPLRPIRRRRPMLRSSLRPDRSRRGRRDCAAAGARRGRRPAHRGEQRRRLPAAAVRGHHAGEFDEQLAVNLRAPFCVARAFLPAMREAGGGSFISVGSVADHAGVSRERRLRRQQVRPARPARDPCRGVPGHRSPADAGLARRDRYRGLGSVRPGAAAGIPSARGDAAARRTWRKPSSSSPPGRPRARRLAPARAVRPYAARLQSLARTDD